MPTYEYRCRNCGHTFDVVQAMSDEPLTVCPVCDGQLRKVFAPVAISFKGSGFYANDHGKSKTTPEKTDEKPAASTESSDTKGDKSGKKDKKESSKPAEKTAASSSAASSSGGSGSTGSSSDGKKESS